MQNTQFLVVLGGHGFHAFFDGVLFVEETRFHVGHLGLFGQELAVFDLDTLLEGCDFLLELRDLGNVIRVVVAIFTFLFGQLGHLGQRFVVIHLGHIRPLRDLVIEIFVPFVFLGLFFFALFLFKHPRMSGRIGLFGPDQSPLIRQRTQPT